jgi:hypothetical protein
VYVMEFMVAVMTLLRLRQLVQAGWSWIAPDTVLRARVKPVEWSLATTGARRAAPVTFTDTFDDNLHRARRARVNDRNSCYGIVAR